MASAGDTGPKTAHATKHRVVIVGAGFGGVSAAKALRRAPVDLTVIDRTNHHLFQGLLYQVATGVLSEGDIAPPTRDLLRRQTSGRVLLGDVVDIDLRAREVVSSFLGQCSRAPYDSLILAAGSMPSYFGNDEFALYAPGMKTIDDALELRGRIFGAFEAAELEAAPERRAQVLTFVVVGAGPTGVETAGQIAELSRRALSGNFRSFDPEVARVVLLDAADAVLPSFPAALQRRARRDLERLGIEVRLGTRVTRIDAKGVDVEEHDGRTERIESRTKIWAAGVQASPLGQILAQQGTHELDRVGRVVVQADCTLPGHPEVFVIGDLMSLDGLPGVAEVAIQSGRHAARTIARRISGRTESRPFRYRDLGTMATISRFNAVAYRGRIQFGGFMGWISWLGVHLILLGGFRNRFAVLADWTVAFVGRGRPQRTITEQQVFSRERALEQRRYEETATHE